MLDACDFFTLLCMFNVYKNHVKHHRHVMDILDVGACIRDRVPSYRLEQIAWLEQTISDIHAKLEVVIERARREGENEQILQARRERTKLNIERKYSTVLEYTKTASDDEYLAHLVEPVLAKWITGKIALMDMNMSRTQTHNGLQHTSFDIIARTITDFLSSVDIEPIFNTFPYQKILTIWLYNHSSEFCAPDGLECLLHHLQYMFNAFNKDGFLPVDGDIVQMPRNWSQERSTKSDWVTEGTLTESQPNNWFEWRESEEVQTVDSNTKYSHRIWSSNVWELTRHRYRG